MTNSKYQEKVLYILPKHFQIFIKINRKQSRLDNNGKGFQGLRNLFSTNRTILHPGIQKYFRIFYNKLYIFAYFTINYSHRSKYIQNQ